MSAISFDGQVVVVTGAGGLLGRRYALEFASRGAAVLVNDIGIDENGRTADAVCAEIRQSGGTAAPSYDSVSTAAGGRAIVERAIDELGGVHIVVNNAGAFRFATFAEMTEEQVDDVLQSHLGAAFYVTQPAWRHMIEQGYGRVINISSSTAFGMQGSANYSAAKAGIIGLTHVLALEGSAHGIRVNAVMPQATHAYSLSAETSVHVRSEEADQLARYKVALGDSGRTGSEWAAGIVLALASRECDINGLTVSTVGGRYARAFLGLTGGWTPTECPGPEDILDHLEQIMDAIDISAPASAIDEVGHVVEQFSI